MHNTVPSGGWKSEAPRYMLHKMSKVQKQLKLTMAVQAYVVSSRISKLFISAIIGYFRLWPGITVLMLRHLHAQYCPVQSHRYTISPLFSILVFSTLHSHCCVVSRHARRASTGLVSTHANGCVALTPFQPAACICIPLCINSVVLQASRERYNAYHCLLAALVFTTYLSIYCP